MGVHTVFRLFEEQNDVGILNRRQIVSNAQNRLSLRAVLDEGFLDGLLAIRIQVVRGLVQQQNFALFEESLFN